MKFETSRSLILGIAATYLFALTGNAAAEPIAAQLIPRTEAARHGLQRTWFTQIELQNQQAKIVDLKLDDGVLFVQSSWATTQAIDANTGKVLWVAELGDRRHPSMPIGVSATRVAVINATTVYVLNRKTGQVEFTRLMEGTPAAGPALDDVGVYCPNMHGQVEVYSLTHDDHRSLANLRVSGRSEVQPVNTELGMAWGSTGGDMAVAGSEANSILFRVATGFPIIASPSTRGKTVYFGVGNGYVHAFNNSTGQEQWTFASGSPVIQSPMPYEDAVYVVCKDRSLFRLAVATGQEDWRIDGVQKFVAATPNRLYVIDSSGRMAILNPKSGAVIDSLKLPHDLIAMPNYQNDQIILASNSGLIQEMHEIELTKRLDYRVARDANERDVKGKKGKGLKKPVDAKTKAPAPAAPKKAVEPVDDPFAIPVTK